VCFSAAGSFTLSGILIGVGAVSIARASSRPYRLFAATPFIFGAQQAAEGIVWLTIDSPTHATLQRLAVSLFLGFALVVWPTWVPLSLQRIEQNPSRRRALTAVLCFGIVVSACAAWLLTRWQPVAIVAGHSIRYNYAGNEHVALHLPLLLAYATATLAPFVLSTATRARTIGVTLLLSVAAATLIRREALTSVWCFFAAILSAQVLIAVKQAHRDTGQRLMTAPVA
jgi:hypothetical protein